jgi:hypothetical protein
MNLATSLAAKQIQRMLDMGYIGYYDVIERATNFLMGQGWSAEYSQQCAEKAFDLLTP